MNEWLKGRLSVGLSFGYISSSEIISLINEYSDYIHDVFFSPTESLRLQTRLNIYNFTATSNEDRLSELDRAVFFCKSKGIKTSLVLNAAMVTADYMADLFEHYNDRYNLDYVTTTSSVARVLKQRNVTKPVVCSYNEGLKSYEEIRVAINSGLFDSLVLGNSFIRDFDAFSLVKSKGLSSILLVNNGCSFGCHNFCRAAGGDYCKRLFDKRLSRVGDASLLYAEQSLFPEELYAYYRNNASIDFYKLSSRPIAFAEYKDLLNSYISGSSSPFIRKNVRNYHLYGRLGHFGSYYSHFDYQSICQEKERIWKDARLIDNTL